MGGTYSTYCGEEKYVGPIIILAGKREMKRELSRPKCGHVDTIKPIHTE
jgi:hypothetical protein